MNPSIANCIFAVGILGLFWLDRDPQVRISKALWLPVIWLWLGGSRNVAEWLNPGQRIDGVNRYLEGNPLDRNVLTALMILGLIVLIARSRRTVAVLASNFPIILYVLYCVVSLSWSEYPFVGLRRWFRLIGDIIMVLVVLTDESGRAAIQHVLKRAAFVLIPISLLLIRYYPDLGRGYSQDGTLFWTGVATGKNGLGAICLIFGFASVWRILCAWQERSDLLRTRKLVAQAANLALVLWLFYLANSMTSFSCFMLASALLIATMWRRESKLEPNPTSLLVRRPGLVHLLVVVVVSASVSVLFLGAGGDVLETMGRDPTLTGRTHIWGIVLDFAKNPIVGAGFETFWLGSTLTQISALHSGMNQAHNGYIEIYLNLGWIGLGLLTIMILRGYRNIFTLSKSNPEVSSLMLGYLVIALVYNCTEGAFKFMYPVWIGFLFSTMLSQRGPAFQASIRPGNRNPAQSLSPAMSIRRVG